MKFENYRRGSRLTCGVILISADDTGRPFLTRKRSQIAKLHTGRGNLVLEFRCDETELCTTNLEDSLLTFFLNLDGDLSSNPFPGGFREIRIGDVVAEFLQLNEVLESSVPDGCDLGEFGTHSVDNLALHSELGRVTSEPNAGESDEGARA